LPWPADRKFCWNSLHRCSNSQAGGHAAGGRRAVQVEVEFIHQQHVGIHALRDFGHVVRLLNAVGHGGADAAGRQRVGEVGQQLAGGVAVQRGIEGREANGFGVRGAGGSQQCKCDRGEGEFHDGASFRGGGSATAQAQRQCHQAEAGDELHDAGGFGYG
jgi:hypothetical protein